MIWAAVRQIFGSTSEWLSTVEFDTTASAIDKADGLGDKFADGTFSFHPVTSGAYMICEIEEELAEFRFRVEGCAQVVLHPPLRIRTYPMTATSSSHGSLRQGGR